MHDGVGEAERKVKLLTLSLGTIAHANQRQSLGKANRNTGVHRADESRHRAGVLVRFTGLILRREVKGVAVLLDFNKREDVSRNFADLTLEGNAIGSNLAVDTGSKDDRNSCNSRHSLSPD